MSKKGYYFLMFVIFSFQGILAQTITVSGVVTDAALGSPLPGVNVIEKGTSNGTATDFDGNYSINVPSNAILVFSTMGYKSIEMSVSGKTSINTSLEEDAQQLGEVVVTALGITKEERKVGYAVSTVGGDNLDKARETNVANSLSGRVAGLVVKGTSSGPGGTSKILLRGVPSLSGSGAPLFVIDGVPMDNTQRGSAGEWGGADQGDGIGNINPDDVEKMTVLKGQSASALYGSRASNGVILITTKKGKKGGGYAISFNSNLMMDDAVDYTDFQDQYGQGSAGAKPTTSATALNTNRFAWGAKLDGSSVIGYDGNEYTYSKAGQSYIDYYRTGTTVTNSLSVSKGMGDGAFRLSLSNLDAKSIVPNSGLKRITANLSADQNITDKLNVAASINYTDERSDNRPYLSDGPKNPNNFLFLAPNVDHRIFAPGYNTETGQEIVFSDDNYVTNPYFIANQGIEDPTRKRTISVLSSKYSFTDNIYALLRLGNDSSNDTYFSVDPYGLDYTTNKAGSLASQGQSTRSELNVDGLLGVKFDVTSDLEFDGLAGANLRRNKYERVSVGGSPFVLPYLYTPGNVVNINRAYEYKERESQSAFYSIDLNYKNFLTLTTTGRYDVYSTLPSSDNSIFTPSVAAAFIFDDFLNIDALDFAKVRASYAVTSGEPGSEYGTSFYYSSGNSINGIPTGSVPSSLPNLGLKPFTTDEVEVGLDLKFFNNRLGLDLAYFKKTTHDEIQNASYSWAAGFSSGVVATGSIENQGLEILLTGVPIRTENFSWSSSVNMSSIKNKVLKTGPDNSPINLGSNRATLGNAVTSFVVGESGPQIRAYDYAYNDDGSIQVDASGLPVRGELKNYGSVLPKFYGGWNNKFTYKNFNLSFLIDFNYGNKVISATEYYSIYRGLNKSTLEGRETGITNNGITADAESYYRALAQNVTSTSIVDGDFIKLRQMSIGYSFPTEMFSKTPFLEGLDISLVGRNLAILMRKAKNIDPESSFGSTINYLGIEGSSLPSTRSFGLNVNLKIK
ncbi:MAG: SusC/RagA family TonB-linked outer membrane protein [Leeuwenhoekiella sp.]